MKVLILSFIVFIHFIFWVIIFVRNFYYQRYYNLTISMVFWVSMLLIIMLMIYAIRKLYRYHELQYKVEMMSQINKIKEKQNRDIELSIISEDVRFKNNINKLTDILDLLNNNEVNIAKSRFNKLYNGLQAKDIIYYCNNSYINAILYNKKLLAEQYGITINCDISLPEKDDIDILDLPSILFNILDNGIDACKNVKNGSIYLKVSFNNNYISIYQKNNNLKKYADSNHGLHGYGLKIVEETVKKYDGVCEWNDMEDYFESIIMLKYKREDFDYDYSYNRR